MHMYTMQLEQYTSCEHHKTIHDLPLNIQESVPCIMWTCTVDSLIVSIQLFLETLAKTCMNMILYNTISLILPHREAQLLVVQHHQ